MGLICWQHWSNGGSFVGNTGLMAVHLLAHWSNSGTFVSNTGLMVVHNTDHCFSYCGVLEQFRALGLVGRYTLRNLSTEQCTGLLVVVTGTLVHSGTVVHW